MSFSFDQFEFISDPRDGKNFNVIKNLEAAVLRGSKLASEILGTLEHQTKDPQFTIAHSKIESDINEFSERWEKIRAFEEDDEGEEDEIEDQDELASEGLEWIEYSGCILSPKTFNLILDSYINFEGAGFFGQGIGHTLDFDLWQLITNPLIPRDLLWEFSVGDSTKLVAQPIEDTRVYKIFPNRVAGMFPRYLDHLSISPVASVNLLKEINKEYDAFNPSPFHLYTMLNANSDIWLLKNLEPDSVRDNLVYELNTLRNGDASCFDEDVFEEKYGWLLEPYFATSSGIIEYNEAEDSSYKFSKSSGCGALLIATRMSEEFKAGIVNIDDHLDSDSEILRTLLYYNPDLDKTQKESLKKLGIIDLDKDVAELYKNAWKPDNPTMVM
jgi:hypothetical protein